jgi:hypothetical protein
MGTGYINLIPAFFSLKIQYYSNPGFMIHVHAWHQGVIDHCSWNETFSRSRELWQTALHGSKDNYSKDSKYYGVQDHLSQHLVDMMKNWKEKDEAERIKKLQIDQVLNTFLRLKGWFLSLCISRSIHNMTYLCPSYFRI